MRVRPFFNAAALISNLFSLKERTLWFMMMKKKINWRLLYMKTRSISKLIFYGVSILCLVGIVVCLICDLAINRALTWSLYTVYSIPFFWLLTLPVILTRRHAIVLTLAVLSASSVPYLYLIEKITPMTGWFMPLALPVAASGILAVWLTYGIYRFLPVNIFYKSALVVALIGIGVNLVVDFSLARYLSTPVSWIQITINILIITAVTVTCCYLGYRKGHPKTAQ